MDTVIIQLTDKKALKLLLYLEEMKIIRVIKDNLKDKELLSNKYRGKLSEDIGEQIKKSIDKSRNEWERNI